MTYAILQISALAYADIRDRLVALDETLNPDPTYASEYILSPRLGGKERLVFGPVAFEALPAEPVHVDDMNDAILVGLALEDDARTIHAEVQAAALRLGASNPQPFESLPAVVREAYITAARKVRAPWVAAANAALRPKAASTAPPETA